MNEATIVKILGTAQDAGVPQANCQCPHCIGARDNPKLRKFAAALALLDPASSRWYLFDATPDLPEQLALLHTDYPGYGLMQGIFLTHAHIGHYAGLMYLGKEAISAESIPVWCGPGMLNLLRSNIPWKQLVELGNIKLRELQADRAVHLPLGVQVTPWLVPHRNEHAETYGFLLTGARRNLLYIPDIDKWETWERSLTELAMEVDYLLLDATFFSRDELVARRRDYGTIPHPLVTATMDLLQSAADRGSYIAFIHTNHTNPLVREDSGAYHEAVRRGFHVARQGQEFVL